MNIPQGGPLRHGCQIGQLHRIACHILCNNVIVHIFWVEIMLSDGHNRSLRVRKILPIMIFVIFQCVYHRKVLVLHIHLRQHSVNDMDVGHILYHLVTGTISILYRDNIVAITAVVLRCAQGECANCIVIGISGAPTHLTIVKCFPVFRHIDLDILGIKVSFCYCELYIHIIVVVVRVAHRSICGCILYRHLGCDGIHNNDIPVVRLFLAVIVELIAGLDTKISSQLRHFIFWKCLFCCEF